MNLRILVLVFVLGIGAIAVGWVYESHLRTKIERADLIIPDNIDYYLTNLHYRVMKTDGNVDYEFNSPRLEHYPRTDVSVIEVPSLQIFRARDHWQVDAINGEFVHQDNILHLRDQVVMQRHGNNPMQMYGESISFEPDRDLVTSDAKISMRTKQARIDAEQAFFDLAGKVYRFNKTRATYYHENI
jgi:LPS export ABC transporter protein LptC